MSASYRSRRVPPMTPAVAIRDTAGIAKRYLLRTIRMPAEASVLVIQPALILLLFRYVLGGAIKVPGGSYADYLVPAVFIEAMLLSGMSTSIGLALDLNSGTIDRFRSLPVARSAVLAGRTLSNLVRSVFALALMIVLGVAVGFRFHCTPAAAFAAMALVIAFGYAFSWVYATIGLLTKDPEVAQGVAVLPVFILMFISPAIVPVATMPGWLQPVARNQPFSVTVNAVRALLQGGPAYHWLWQSIAWSAGILLIFFLVAVHLYRDHHLLNTGTRLRRTQCSSTPPQQRNPAGAPGAAGPPAGAAQDSGRRPARSTRSAVPVRSPADQDAIVPADPCSSAPPAHSPGPRHRNDTGRRPSSERAPS